MVKSVKNLFESIPMLKPSDINGVLISTNENSKYLAAEISELFGLQPNHAYSVENLCSSGSNAVFSAMLAFLKTNPTLILLLCCL